MQSGPIGRVTYAPAPRLVLLNLETTPPCPPGQSIGGANPLPRFRATRLEEPFGLTTSGRPSPLTSASICPPETQAPRSGSTTWQPPTESSWLYVRPPAKLKSPALNEGETPREKLRLEPWLI